LGTNIINGLAPPNLNCYY